jgi:hypothetical protein
MQQRAQRGPHPLPIGRPWAADGLAFRASRAISALRLPVYRGKHRILNGSVRTSSRWARRVRALRLAARRHRAEVDIFHNRFAEDGAEILQEKMPERVELALPDHVLYLYH